MALATFTGIGSVLVIGLALSASCGGDDETRSGACSPDTNDGCTGGQVCRVGKDGNPSCFCSVDADSGCPKGLECAAAPGGDPGCYCSPEYDTGCETGLVCEIVPGHTPACFPPVTIAGKVFDLATDAAIA